MIPIDEESALFLSECRHELSSIIESKFGCTLIFHNIENGRPSESWRAHASPDIRYSITLPKGLKVSVWKDDLTTHEVDAVVNAANDHLCHKAGLALALSKAGGPVIQKESDKIIRSKSRLKTGEAVVTSAGNLPCKRVIHTVGPELSSRPQEKEVEKATPALKKAVFNILKQVEEEHLHSVAIPAISSGLFNFPLKRCADTIVKTLKEYHDKEYIGIQALEVRLIDLDDHTVRQMERSCQEILSSNKTYSKALNGPRKNLVETSVQVCNAWLHIKRDLIEQQQVDVIVNTISQDFNLSAGEISNAILKQAGSGIQREIRHIMQNKHLCSCGDVIETQGYYLRCMSVYHAVCAERWNRSSMKILTKVVHTCLHKAVSSGMRSISFPAIGTGQLKFKKSEVAHILVQEAAAFAKETQATIDIFFVLFPSDHETIEAFEEQITSLKSVVRTSSAFRTNNTGAGGDAAQMPCIEVCGPSSEQTREAERWIIKLFRISGTHQILDNHILHFGLKEYDQLLSIRSTSLVVIKESFDHGMVEVNISGTPKCTKIAVLKVEALCSQVQEDFARAEEDDLLYALVRWQCEEIPKLHEPMNSVALERAYLAGCDTQPITVDGQVIDISFKTMKAKDMSGKCYTIIRKCEGIYKNPTLLDDYTAGKKSSKKSRKCFYQRKAMEENKYVPKEKELFAGLKIVKVEKIENPLLEHHFQLKQQQLGGNPKRMYKQVSAQFCDLVCRVGFQKMYSLPRNQKLGGGIYFYSSIEALRKHEDDVEKEEYIYIFEAQVLTGRSTKGSPGLILPPPLHADPLVLYDSLTGETDTHVIFNSRQALPKYLITCTKASAGETH